MKPEFLINGAEFEKDDLDINITVRDNAPDTKAITGKVQLNIVGSGNFSEYLKEDNTLDEKAIARDIHIGVIKLTTLM